MTSVRFWRLIRRVLFLKPKRQPIEVALRLNQYAHERKLRFERYAAKWDRQWADAAATKRQRRDLWLVK